MSSGCGDVLSLADLQTAKKHQLFEAEVVTGKQGGIAGGADIDYATNQVTGQTQKTLPAVLRDAGFHPASFTFATGGTLGVNDADLAVLWPGPSGDGQYYVWHGALPKTIPADSSPATTGGVADTAWVPFGDITLRNDLASAAVGKGASLVNSTDNRTVQAHLDDFSGLDAFGKLGKISYAGIRAYTGPATMLYCYGRVDGVVDAAAGIFRRDSSIAAPVDDGGYLLVDGSGRAWVRVGESVNKAAWWGVKYDGFDESAALQSAVNASTGKTLHLDGVVTVASTINMNGKILLSSQNGNQSGTSGITKNTAGAMLFVGAVDSGVEISNLVLTHNGDGRVIDMSGGETHRVRNCSIIATLTTSTADLIYFTGSNTWIESNRITTLRAGSFCVNCDRTTKIQINSIVSKNYFGGTGKGVRVGTSTGSARPEGVLVSENICVLTGETFLHVFSVLSLRCVNNMIDQCNYTAILLEPITFPVEAVLISGNYLATPDNLEGICIHAVDNAAGSTSSGITIVNNKFEHSGYGIVTGYRCAWLKVLGNEFSNINHAGLACTESVAVNIANNQFNLVSPQFAFSLTDGASGGNYNIIGNYVTGQVNVIKSHAERWQVTGNTGYS